MLRRVAGLHLKRAFLVVSMEREFLVVSMVNLKKGSI